MKRALLIDFDGTLCHDRFWRSADEKTRITIQEFLFSPDNNRIVTEWMRGFYSSEEIHAILGKELNLDVARLWRIFVDDCRTMQIEKDVLNRILLLRNDLMTILVTDNMDCFSRFTVPALNLERYFDMILNSADIHMLKNDDNGAVYKNIFADNCSDITHSILIDDSEKSCELFKRLGGIAYHVSSERSVHDLFTSL